MSMLFDDKPYSLDRVVRLALTGGVLWGTVALLGYLSGVLIPFAAALLLAYILNPVVLRIQRVVRKRAPAVWLTLIGVTAVLTFLGWLLIPLISGEVGHMRDLVSDLVNNSQLAEEAASRLPPDIWLAVKDYLAREEVQAFFRTDNFLGLLETGLQKLVPGVWGLITGTASVFMWMAGLAIILLYLVFLLMDFQKVRQGWTDYLPRPYRKSIVEFVSEFDTGMNRYFRAQAAVAFIVGVLCSIGFSLIGLPLAILLGMFIGLLNMVPYLQTLGFIPAFFLAGIHALETGTGFWSVLGLVVLVFAVVQVLQDAVLVPKIMGKVMGLSPAMILLSLSVWGKLLGLLGLLIALPVTCLLLAYYRRMLDASGDREEGA
ncbi:MAG TPA: AI-2E family transporter [Desulfomicrobiaceae bacterium]|nr:AI-2E family transporter [Desulfomicrobiaceae bacterium]